jgi:tRNA pseudouridine38-40 synthase
MTKYALRLEYDGSYFHGWQTQLGVATVQGHLDAALSKFANEPITTITAGRTDSGVHGLNQVVHFSSSATRKLEGWVRGVNANLPPSIRIKAVAEVAADFDARFTALSRTYHYYLLNQAQPAAHLAQLVGWYHGALELAQIQAAAKLLIGRHDFSAFRAAGCQANTPVRTLHALTVEKRGRMLRFSFTANAFLQHMVRNLMGALIYVGANRLTVAELAVILQSADRKNAPPTFMPNGLYLVDVGYPAAIFAPYQDEWLYY